MADQFVVSPPHIAISRKPMNLSSADEALFSHGYALRHSAAHVLRAGNIRVIGDFLVDGFRFLTDYSHEPARPPAVGERLKQMRRLTRRPERLEKGVWIINKDSTNYYHWIVEALSRLEMCSTYLSGHKVILPKWFQEIAFVRESLFMLGIEPHYYDYSRPLLVEDAIVASHAAPLGSCNGAFMLRLRNRILEAAGRHRGPPTRVHLSRQSASRRRIVNFDAVQEVVERFGMETHATETYSFEKQVSVFGGCETLLSLHGAGMTNMLFMPKGGRVVEIRLRGDKWLNTSYHLASALDLDYYYVLAEGDGRTGHFSDVTVDPRHVAATLAEAIG